MAKRTATEANKQAEARAKRTEILALERAEQSAQDQEFHAQMLALETERKIKAEHSARERRDRIAKQHADDE